MLKILKASYAKLYTHVRIASIKHRLPSMLTSCTWLSTKLMYRALIWPFSSPVCPHNNETKGRLNQNRVIVFTAVHCDFSDHAHWMFYIPKWETENYLAVALIKVCSLVSLVNMYSCSIDSLGPLFFVYNTTKLFRNTGIWIRN